MPTRQLQRGWDTRPILTCHASVVKMAHKPQFRCLKRPVVASPDRELCASRRGYGARWRKVARSVRDRDAGLCRRCLEVGGLSMAAASLVASVQRHVVDHVIPAHVRPDLFYDEVNLQVLCPLHHAEKTADDLRKWGAAPR